MGRVAKGSVTERSGKLYARVTLKSGKRVLHLLGARADFTDEAAQALAAEVSEGFRSGRFVHASEEPKAAGPADTKGPEETVEQWHARWTLGRTWTSHVGSDRSRYKLRIRPILGPLAIAAVTRDDCERLVESLDGQAEDGTISAKTATNTWSVAQAMFRDAYKGKDKRFRARNDDPTADVAPPDKADKKARVYLYPNEASTLWACPDVALDHLQLYALAAYSGLRASELAALRWEDVDLAADVISVTKAVDRSVGTLRPTKNHETRRVPIDPALRPMLEKLHARTGPVLSVPVSKLAEEFRKDLRRAGLTRSALHASSATEKPMTFHDLRATAITWWALQALPLHVIMRRAGHLSPATTMVYIREAETLGRNIGMPFPPLPASLGNRHQQSAPTSGNKIKRGRIVEPPWGLEPQEDGQDASKTGGTAGVDPPVSDQFGGVLAPGAKWLVPLPDAVEVLRAALRPRGPLKVRYARLLEAANDVVAAWDRGAA